jgi:FMN phosphatase YigB (HAD superfamily)
MPQAYNALWTTTKQRMKRVNHFIPITKHVENERMARHDRSGNEIFSPRLTVLLFVIPLVFCPRSDQNRHCACLAFVAPISSLPQFSYSSSKVSKIVATPFVDDTSHASNASKSFGCQELGLLTFDLDDTLFSINETVMDANAGQLQYMKQVLISKNCHLTFNMTVQDFQDKMYDVRRDIVEPVSYTELRKMTIRRTFLENGRLKNVDSYEVDRYVENTFDVWLQERHLAAERYLFADALAALRELKDIYPDTCIAAITNGRGDPTRMVNSLAPFFDFCISGEDDDVFPNRKPSPKIFELAAKRYQQLYPHHSTLSECAWCHVGDCLINDVGASAACGAFAIWYCPKEMSYMDSGTVSESHDVESQRQLLADMSQPTKTKKIALRVKNLAELPTAIAELLQQKVGRTSNS